MAIEQPESRSVARVLFGPFELNLSERSLKKADEAIPLGARAFDILVTLIDRAGETVGKDELIAKVWPDVNVEEGSLRVHLSALRKVLGTGQFGRKYIINVQGRGYSFVEPVTREQAGADTTNALVRSSNLPAPLDGMMIGRDDVVLQIRSRLGAERLITILGAGGIGKTTVALAVGQAALIDFAGAVFFLDLSVLRSKDQVIAAMASTIGLVAQPGDPEDALLEFLHSRRALLLLDSCEHLIEEIAKIADRICQHAPDIHVLATSREALQTVGEQVFRLQPLDCPPEQPDQTADEILSYPATRLFMERVGARGVDLALGSGGAAFVAEICRRLDGIPLAIELAAGRAAIFGVRDIAAKLALRLDLLKLGRRAASPRHQTLRATLDWSHDLLSEIERAILRRVAIFVGRFTLEAALAVAQQDGTSQPDATDALGNLVEKSLIGARIDSWGASYRLLDTTRAYALEKLVASGEHRSIATRHANYSIQMLKVSSATPIASESASTEHLARYAQEIDNVRSALDWAFSPTGNTELGIELVVAAIPLWMRLSLVAECGSRVKQALGVLGPERAVDGPLEMKLYGALGFAAMLTKGAAPEAATCLRKALAIAEAVGDDDYQLRVLWGLWSDRNINAEFRESLSLAERFRSLASRSGDPVDIAIGERMTGFVRHYIGDHAAARRHIERMLALQDDALRYDNIARFQFDPWVTARVTLARVLCIQGLPEQAMEMLERGVAEALTIDHATTQCNVLAKACPVALFARDLAAAERFILLLERAVMQGLSFWQAEGRGYRGVFHLMRGETEEGVRLVRSAFGNVETKVVTPPYPHFLGALAEGQSSLGEITEALHTVDQAIAYCEFHEEVWYLPELLRIKGEISRGAGSDEIAQDLFLRSLDLARNHGALLWELRAATNLARLWQGGGRVVEARELLLRAYGQFREGFATPDLLEAKALLSALAVE
ncbi:winged helix-turn-helix domain-containing protein [Rhizobium calliandrae]|uniref:Winged helix-turn-helix domain-containing protein n=1 Tax=Rhizobium calliandrae TaxID=1312182 RepID=A0ABT7KC67_9HYPH|nr:winged helix-turn-helix domain-containing protein [Rhizobium calliandrae]MDL2406213.1 winged helix-turn-helix domain-containing protein [Rhizobium calliandrae]